MTERCDAPCCDMHEVPLLEADVSRLEQATGRRRAEFVDEANGWLLLRGAGADDAGCVFLGEVAPDGRPMRGCTVHADRPVACRNYPFVLKRGGSRPRVERDGLCPYNRQFAMPESVAHALVDLWRKLEEERRARGGP